MTPQTKKSSTLYFICSLFIFLFVYTALSKLQDYHSFRFVLSKSPLIGAKSKILAPALPSVELVVAFLLFFPGTRTLGLYSSLALMTVFTLYIAYMLLFSPQLPCSCGGVIRYMSWTQHLLFNLLFTALAVLGVYIDSKYSRPKEQREDLYPNDCSYS